MRKLLIVLLIVIPQIHLAQSIEGYFSAGVGSYKLDDIKTIFRSITYQIPFPIQVVDNFPNYYNYDVGFNGRFLDEKLEAGLSVLHMSSGARANVSDYSGSYNMDMTVSSNGFSLNVGYRFYTCKWFELNGKARLGRLYTKLDIDETYQLYEQERDEVISFKSESTLLEPVFEVSKSFKYLSLFANVGYLYDFKGEIHLPEDKDAVLQIDGRKAQSDWSGYRLRAGLKFIIPNLY